MKAEKELRDQKTTKPKPLCISESSPRTKTTITEREREREAREMSASGVTQQHEEDKKPNDQSAHINLKVKGQVPPLVFSLSLFFRPRTTARRGISILVSVWVFLPDARAALSCLWKLARALSGSVVKAGSFARKR